MKSIKTQKKELGEHPAILTSRLVNNAYEYILYRPIQFNTTYNIHTREDSKEASPGDKTVTDFIHYYG